MIDVQKIFEELNRADGFIKIKIEESPVGIYCGVKENGLPCLAFMSQHPPLTIESTQYLQVTQWSENILYIGQDLIWDLEMLERYFIRCV